MSSSSFQIISNKFYDFTTKIKEDSNDPNLDNFLIFANNNFDFSNPITEDKIIEKIDTTFVADCKTFLENYKPLYLQSQKVYKLAYDTINNIEKMENNYSEIKFRNQNFMSKIRKFKEIDEDIKMRKTIIENIINDSNIKNDIIDILINENTVVNEEFFIALHSLEKLGKLQENLDELNLEKNGLKASLQKNVNEIRNLAFAKLIKYINKNISKIENSFLIKSISVLKPYNEIYDKFMKLYFKYRRVHNNNILNDIINNNLFLSEKDYNRYFTDLFNALLKAINEEIEYLKGVFGEEFQQNVFLESIFNEIFTNIYNKTEKFLINEEDFFRMFLIYKLINDNYLEIKKFMTNQFLEGNIIFITNKELENSQIMNLMLKMIKSTETLIKKNLVSQGVKLVTSKYNIQNFNTYGKIIDFVSKIKLILKFQSDSENKNEKLIFSVDLLLKPIIDLITYKLNEYNNAIQVYIFAINIYQITIDELHELQIFNEKYEKLKNLIDSYINIIEEDNFIEFKKKICFHNDNENSDKYKNIKNKLDILLLIHKDQNYKNLFKDIDLIMNKQLKELLQTNLIKNFLLIYKNIYSSIIDYCKELSDNESLSTTEINNIIKEKIDQTFDLKINLIPPDSIGDFLKN